MPSLLHSYFAIGAWLLSGKSCVQPGLMWIYLPTVDAFHSRLRQGIVASTAHGAIMWKSSLALCSTHRSTHQAGARTHGALCSWLTAISTITTTISLGDIEL